MSQTRTFCHHFSHHVPGNVSSVTPPAVHPWVLNPHAPTGRCELSMLRTGAVLTAVAALARDGVAAGTVLDAWGWGDVLDAALRLNQ